MAGGEDRGAILWPKKMICSTPAFVLRSFDFRETSKIAVFFSKEFGKIKGILKGIRKDPRKFSSTLSLLSLNHLIFYRKRTTEIHLVSQCDLIDHFGLIGDDLGHFARAARVIELTDILLPLEDPHPQVFSLIFDLLNTMKGAPPESRLFFQIKILALSGFKPRFDSCVVCDAHIGQEAYFSLVRGGLICRRCLGTDKSSQRVLPGTIASILYVERTPWASCLRLNLSPAVKKQLEGILAGFLHFHVGKSLKTDRIAQELMG